MGFYRSEQMRLYQLTVHVDDAWNVMNEFGDIGLAQFIDLNKEEVPYSLPYTMKVKSCEESERKLQYLLDQCKRNFIRVTPPENIQGFLTQLKRIKENKKKAINLLLDEIQKDITDQEAFVQEQNKQLKDNENSLTKLKDQLQVLKTAQSMIPELQGQLQNQGDMERNNNSINAGGDDAVNLLENDANRDGNSINIQHVAGVIEQQEIARLRKLIFRATKGKSYMYIQEYPNDAEDDEIQKPKRSVFIIVFWDGNHIRDRIQRICDTFQPQGQRIELPEIRQIPAKIEEVKEAITTARSVFVETKQSLREVLMKFDKIDADGVDKTSSTIYIYKMFLAKEKALYKTLNCMKSQNQQYIGYYWAPIEEENKIKQALQDYTACKISAYDNHSIPRPTYFKISEFTFVFQSIVDTYGVPAYLEANPALITIVTFPFFFGMMFGDMGHGSLFLLFGLVLVLGNDALKSNPALKDILQLRYLLLLMGFFATYCGLIYNEFFSIQTDIFGSCYNKKRERWNPFMNDTHSEEMEVSGTFVYLRSDFDCTYLMGQDPVWGLASNKLTLINNIKMKMSVIFGVVHMSMGIFIKGTNAVFNRDYATLITEVVAGFIILWGLFGWMDALIIAKWFHRIDIQDTTQVPGEKFYYDSESEAGDNYIGAYRGDYENQRAPSVINIMIVMIFSFCQPKGVQEQWVGYIPDGDQNKQFEIALVLLVLVVVFVPVMLLVKPMIFLASHQDDPAQDEIEFTDIRNGDGPGIQSVGSNGGGYQAVGNGEEVSKGDELQMKRENEMKSLDQQLKDMGHHESHTFGEYFIHQMIETIEFVLGTVSNTASYLRLWALSLAHGQLAEVFMSLLFKYAFQAQGTLMTVVLAFVLWPAFWSVTFSVLMLMDSLECFLHTLRLHWVEFQNKFYKGDGYAFKPYSYNTVLGGVLEQQ